MIIGITGGTGSGKTTLLEQVKKLDGLVLDCDAIYHSLLTRDQVLLRTIETRFPGTVVNGVLDRKKLGRLVFSDGEALEALNEITHGAVKAEVLRQLQSAPKLVAIDAIALFESGLAELCDVTVGVTAPMEQRVARLMARERIGEDYARARISAQNSDDWFREKCDYILENDGSREAFCGKCLAFLTQLGIMDL